MATDKKDYYEVLGVSRDVDKSALKKAYRRLARQYHPDVNKDPGADERFKEISEAYEVLSDEEKRAVYDRYGHSGFQNGFGGQGGFSGAGFGGMSDIFEEIFGFNTGRRQRRGPRRGADLRYDLTLEFEEAVFGADKELNIRRPEPCDACDATGAEPGSEPIKCTNCNGSGEVRRQQQSIFGSLVNVSTCPVCQGTGELIPDPCKTCNGQKQVQKVRQRMVKIPPGVDSDTQIRITGEGSPGEHGGPPGNLYVFINVRKHKYFQRRGNDILLDLRVNVAQAALGDEVKVPVVDGHEEDLVIPAGTQSGTILKITNKGVPQLRRTGRGDYKTDRRGDQLVVIQVDIPKKLTDEQRDLFQQLSRTLGREAVAQQDKGILSQLKETLGDIFGIG
ncbi:MAG TPA: molecular chaperone DnaJ [Anaerolineae bacterium]|nr:molecular chaperone DnaJ [Anaerolineae bacterium]